MAPYSSGFSSAHRSSRSDDTSIVDELLASASRFAWLAWGFGKGQSRSTAVSFLARFAHQLRRNLSARRLLSFPHLLVAFWLVALLWGERWAFGSKVEQCHWDKWEQWPAGSHPHRLVLVADPQLIDPHSYPGRPWPINPLTILITDNYLRRSYNQLVAQLRPSTILFLGDLFDGGREWKTSHGDFSEPQWSHRPGDERGLLKKWNKVYGQDFWLKEYQRFGDIFLEPWKATAEIAGDEAQRGRKIITSLPGNHDLGFGSEIKLAVRERFETFFGEGNRVNVIGNHTFVSVDTVSLSADTSEQRDAVKQVYEPTERFLKNVDWEKRKAVAKELRFLKGGVEEVTFPHRIEDVDKADFTDAPKLVSGKDAADLPSILLTHVPLYRPPGTPCGPLREHWPPAKPPKGQKGPVVPDHRNAISVSGGYQYQNVLSEQDSIDIIQRVGNVVHAFSGDDHDYCEVTHDAKQGGVPEITVKSISMAMGVPTPGFLMVSLYNPIDADGKPLPGAPKTTLQTHLCLLPNQLRTFSRYGALVVVSLLALGLRAFLVPILNLTPFALPSLPPRNGAMLPLFRAKGTDQDRGGLASTNSGTSGFLSSTSLASSHPRDRSQSSSHEYNRYDASGSKSNGRNVISSSSSGKLRHSSSQRQSKFNGVKWGWGSDGVRTPKIEIRGDDDDYVGGGKWKAARHPGGRLRPPTLATVGRELWTTTWRVTWMVVCIWAWLAWKG